MFVGHYSVSFAARRTNDTPLWIWFIAVQWLDLFFMVFVLAGVEKMRLVPGFTETNDLDLYSMPYSHGLVGAAVLSVLFAALVAALRPAARKPLTLALLAIAVFSHWILDLIVHTPDLSIVSGDPKVGLGLWNHLAIEFPLELALIALFAWLYARGTGVRRGRTCLLVAVMAVLQVYATFGPAPASTPGFAVTALVAYVLLIAVAWWVEQDPISSAAPNAANVAPRTG